MPEFDERLTYLFASYTDNSCTREELQELLARLGPAEEAMQELMDDYYARLKAGASADAVDWESMFDRIIRQPARKPVRQLTWKRWMAAAVLVVLAGIGSYLVLRTGEQVKKATSAVATATEKPIAPGAFKALLTLGDGQKIGLDSVASGKVAQQGAATITSGSKGLVYADDHSKKTETLYNSLSTARGQTYSFTMADGTKVWLDAATTIRFPAEFRGDERSVELLNGQAYFEVAANVAKPFFVRQGRTSIQVLGTHFNVNAYSDDDILKVTLLEGGVRVESGTEARAVVLKPGDQARIGGRKVTVVEGVDADQVIAWKNGLFSFKNTGLGNVMKELSRWYAIDVSYEGDAPDIAITGKAPRSIDLETMLKVLQLSDVRYRIEGRQLIITR